jgi:hypothetical protein
MTTTTIMQHPTETMDTAHGPLPVAYAVESWDDGTYYVSWGIVHPSGDYEAIDVVCDVCWTLDDATRECAVWAHAR